MALNDLFAFASHGPLAALRGAGRMGFAALATLLPFNLLALPLAAYLMFWRHPSLGLAGYWLALDFGINGIINLISGLDLKTIVLH